jgi:hypothetical protein
MMCTNTHPTHLGFKISQGETGPHNILHLKKPKEPKKYVGYSAEKYQFVVLS